MYYHGTGDGVSSHRSRLMNVAYLTGQASLRLKLSKVWADAIIWQNENMSFIPTPIVAHYIVITCITRSWSDVVSRSTLSRLRLGALQNLGFEARQLPVAHDLLGLQQRRLEGQLGAR